MKSLRQASALLLVVALSTGCATRQLDFRSTPSGATVQVGDRQCTTPCTLAVDSAVTTATFAYAADTMTVALPENSKAGNFGYQSLDKTETALAAAAAAFLVLGISAFTVVADDLERNDDPAKELAWLTVGSFAAAGLLALGARGVAALRERSRDEVWALFGPGDLPSLQPAQQAQPPLPPQPLPRIPDDFRLDNRDLQRLFPVRDAAPSGS